MAGMAIPERDTDASTGRPGRPRDRGGLVLAAMMALTVVLGSLHGFSVLVDPLESTLGVDRTAVSSVYSLALVSLTTMVLIGHRITADRSPAFVVAAVAVLAGAGLVLADRATSITALRVGYGIAFGGANGLGYGYALRVAAAATPNRRGFAIGSVTASYALGATVFALLLDRWADAAALFRLAAVVGSVAGAVAIMLALTGFAIDDEHPTDGGRTVDGTGTVDDPAAGAGARRFGLQAVLWAGYGLAAASGLMAIGHAAGIVESVGGGGRTGATGAALIGVGNAVGGFAVAGLADRTPVRRLLVGLPLLSAAGLVMLLLTSAPGTALAALVVVGVAYGAVIAVYPFAVSELFGPAIGPVVYGRVFTAWGLAGLAGPWAAGVAFDAGGDYGPALLGACGAGLASAALARFVPSGTDMRRAAVDR